VRGTGCSSRAAEGADQFALVAALRGDVDVRPRVLLDPPATHRRGGRDRLVRPSPDGSLVALGLSEGGTEDSVSSSSTSTTRRSRASRSRARARVVAWTPDGPGFWYARYPSTTSTTGTSLPRLGTIPDDDPVVFDSLPTEQSWPDVQASPDGRYLLVEMLVGGGGSTRTSSTSHAASGSR
jgi:prolyl oligopeptidase